MQIPTTIYFYTRIFRLKGAGFRNTMKRIFSGGEVAWFPFLEPALNRTSPYTGMAVGAKTKNAKDGQASTNILESISGDKMLSLTDLRGHGLRYKLFDFSSNIFFYVSG